eukprot:5280006-Amphidinium_carterae.1
MVIVAAHRDILNPDAAMEVSFVDWRSQRSRRVTSSTLSAESIVLDSAIDHILSPLWGKALNHKQRRDVTGYLPWNVFIDCRSLYEAVAQENAAAEEKRALIDICVMREALFECSAKHTFLSFPELSSAIGQAQLCKLLREVST